METVFKRIGPNTRRKVAAAAAVGSIAVPTIDAPPTTSPAASLPNPDRLAAEPNLPSELRADYLVQARRHRTRHHKRYRFTGYEVVGQTSTFGTPADSYNSGTADMHSTSGDACIALRNDATLDHRFLLTVIYDHKKHQQVTYQCDWGPGIYHRAIDITGAEVWKLHLNPLNYPTDHAWGSARELKGPKVRP